MEVNVLRIILWALQIIVPIGIIVGLVLYFKNKKNKTGIP